SYGNLVSETNAANGDRFKYAAREYDPLLGLYYDRARYYNPATGRFLSEDPSGFGAGDANLYRYVGNSPTNATDPSGLGPQSPLEQQFAPQDSVGAAGLAAWNAYIASHGVLMAAGPEPYPGGGGRDYGTSVGRPPAGPGWFETIFSLETLK